MDTIIQSSPGPAKRSSYRHHPIDFKRAILEQSLIAGASVSLVAREHDINANQVFAWRKLYKDGLLDAESSKGWHLLPVMLAGNPPTKKMRSEVEFSYMQFEDFLHEDIALYRQPDHADSEAGRSWQPCT